MRTMTMGVMLVLVAAVPLAAAEESQVVCTGHTVVTSSDIDAADAEATADTVETARSEEDPREVEALRRSAQLTDERLAVRREAAQALRAGHWRNPLIRERPRAALAEDADALVRGDVARALTFPGSDHDRDALLKAMTGDPDPVVRRVATWSLVGYSGSDLARAMLAALKSPDPRIRLAALSHRGLNQLEEAADRVEGLLADDDPRVRQKALHRWPQLLNCRAALRLARVMTDPQEDLKTRRTAIVAAMQLSSESQEMVIDALAAAAAEPALAEAACQVLGHIHFPSSINTLLAMLESPSADLRRAAAGGMERLNGSGPIVTPLLARLKDEDPGVRQRAIRALAKTDSQQQLVVDSLRDVLTHGDAADMPVAAASLGAMGPVAVPALVGAAGDPRCGIEAVNALLTVHLHSGDPRVPEAFGSFLRSDDAALARRAATALRGQGSRDFGPILVEALGTDEVSVLLAVIDALGSHGDARAVEPLKALLKDSRQDVRDAAAEAIDRIEKAAARRPARS